MAADKDIDPSSLGVSPDRNGVLNDSEMDGLSLYEKKVLLVNRELDSHGMGKYQVRSHSANQESHFSHTDAASGTYSFYVVLATC